MVLPKVSNLILKVHNFQLPTKRRPPPSQTHYQTKRHPGTHNLTVRGETSRTPNLDFLESKVLRIPFSTQIKSRNLESLKSAKWHFSDTERRTPNSHRKPNVSETPQTYRITSRHQSKNTSKLRIISEHTDASNIS